MGQITINPAQAQEAMARVDANNKIAEEQSRIISDSYKRLAADGSGAAINAQQEWNAKSSAIAADLHGATNLVRSVVNQTVDAGVSLDRNTAARLQ